LKTTGQFYQTESDTTPQSSTSFTTNKTEETTASPYKALDSWYYSTYSAKKAFNENYKQGIIESLRKQGKNNKEIYNELNNIFNIWFNQNYKKQNGTVFGPIYKRN
jgi:hypothetical protein